MFVNHAENLYLFFFIDITNPKPQNKPRHIEVNKIAHLYRGPNKTA